MLSRERGIIAAALAVIEDPSYAVEFPDHIANWDPLVSSVSAVREALKIRGRSALQFTFMLSVTAVCGGPFTPGLYGMLEGCLLSEDIFLAITKKIPKRKGVGLVATSNDTVSSAWYIFVGALFDATGLTVITEWIKGLFIPLVRAAIAAYNIFRPSKKAKKTGGTTSPEVRVLQRLRKTLMGQKALKAQNSNSDAQTPPASDTEDEGDDKEGDDDLDAAFAPGHLHSPFPTTEPSRMIISHMDSEASRAPKRKMAPDDDDLPLAQPRSSFAPSTALSIPADSSHRSLSMPQDRPSGDLGNLSSSFDLKLHL